MRNLGSVVFIRLTFMEKSGRTIPTNLRSYKRIFRNISSIKGSVNYDESVETLKNYFALVFPTLFIPRNTGNDYRCVCFWPTCNIIKMGKL